MADVGLLAYPPGRLGRLVGVRAARHDVGHGAPEPTPDLHQLLGPVVFNRIVEKGRDRLVLGSSVLEGDARGAQKVGQIRDRRALADVAGVEPRGENEGLVESFGEPEQLRYPSVGLVFSDCATRVLTTTPSSAGSTGFTTWRL